MGIFKIDNHLSRSLQMKAKAKRIDDERLQNAARDDHQGSAGNAAETASQNQNGGPLFCFGDRPLKSNVHMTRLS